MSWDDPTYRRPKIPQRVKLEVIIRDKLICVQCDAILHLGKTIYSVINGVFHHIIPMVYGGENEAFNICLLCKTCHDQAHKGREDKRKYFFSFENFIRTGRLF